MHMDMSKEHFYARIIRKNAAPCRPGQPFVRACAGETHMDSHTSRFTRELQEMPRPKIGSTILFEPAQRKCMWTCRKSRFTREFTGKMLRPKTGTRFCASLRSRNALGHVRRAILCENSHGKCRAARSRKTRGAEFVRAYAIEMHMGMWPRTKIYRTKTGTQMEHPDQATALTLTARALQCGHIDWGNLREKTRPRPGQPFGASLRGRNAFGLRRVIFCDILLQTGTAVLREIAQSECIWTFEKSRLMREFTRKMPKTRATVLCESAQSKCTWTCHKTFVRKFKGKNYAGQQMEQADQAPALTPTVRTPQCGHTVWGITSIFYFAGSTSQKKDGGKITKSGFQVKHGFRGLV